MNTLRHVTYNLLDYGRSTNPKGKHRLARVRETLIACRGRVFSVQEIYGRTPKERTEVFQQLAYDLELRCMSIHPETGDPTPVFDPGPGRRGVGVLWQPDVEPVAGTEMLSLIEQSVLTLLNDDLIPLSLGGDHSITYPAIKAVSSKQKNLSVLHFDAHPDLYDDFQGNRYSHASPFARLMEEGLVKRLVQVGIRTINRHQREQADRFGVEVWEMRHWRDHYAPQFDAPVYISFDIDALDPAFAPGVSHREPGGLTTRQALDLIINLRGQIVGADIVEFNPRMDPLHVTATVCAKLLKEIAAKMLLGS